MSGSRLSIIQSRAVEDRSISDSQFRTLAALGIFGDKNGWCFPSLQTLGEILHKSKPIISRDIKRLVDLGYVEVYRRYRENGGQTSNLYRVILDPPLTSDVTPPLTSDVNPLTTQFNVNDSIYDDFMSPTDDLLFPQSQAQSVALPTPQPTPEPPKLEAPPLISESSPDYLGPRTDGQAYLLYRFKAKRFKNAEQKEHIENLEEIYGLDKLKAFIDWAARSGMTIGRAVSSAEKTLKTWGIPKRLRKPPIPVGVGPAHQPKENPDGSFYV